MKKLLIALAIIATAFVAWWFYDSVKPKLFAKVGFNSSIVEVTNGNDAAWRDAEVLLNIDESGMDIPRVIVKGEWAPGETKRLALADFKRGISQHAFNPEFEKARQVSIQASGYQLATYSK